MRSPVHVGIRLPVAQVPPSLPRRVAASQTNRCYRFGDAQMSRFHDTDDKRSAVNDEAVNMYPFYLVL